MKSEKFILPDWGGAMVHSDPQMTENINLPIPKNNVKLLWHKNELKGEKAGAKGNGIAGNGKIAACTFHSILKLGGRDNLVIYDYDGNHLWKSGKKLNPIAVSSTPMVDINDRIIACDDRTIIMVAPNDNGFEIEWSKHIPTPDLGPKVIFPLSPTIINNETIILPTNGPLYAFNVHDGSLLSWKYLGLNEVEHNGYFSTINSISVNNNRIYITTKYRKPNFLSGKTHCSRLYAIDLNLNADDPNDILTEVWHYDFLGTSQASPLFIDDTVYFDGYTGEIFGDSYVYGITDLGAKPKKKWKVLYPQHKTLLSHRTMFSFSKDPRPRGGLWYEDHQGRRLVRFDTKDGSIIDEILINKLMKKGGFDIYKPMSCMNICDEAEPVMIVSAISFLPYHQYVLAIDLADNSLIWKVRIPSFFGYNSAGGQFTIMKKDSESYESRLVFGTYLDGVMAIGEVN